MDNGVIKKSVTWSFSSEIAAKLISPVINIILARILLPSDFGVVAVCNMVVSFVDIITDAGFGKYLVQHEFVDEKEKNDSAVVAFWTNLAISVLLWVAILANAKGISSLMGNVEYYKVLPIACLQLIFTSFSSIQIGLLRREFSFKKLFYVRIAVSFVPLMITLPIALIFRSYWSLIIGNLSAAFINSVLLIIVSKWKPRMFYSIDLLQKMFGYSIWSIAEALAHWLIFWVDIFIVGKVFDDYYLGIYKNCSNMIFSLMSMIISAITPVMFSVLSREQNTPKFKTSFLVFEKNVMYVVFPIGIGLFFYRRLATLLLFGARWEDGIDVVGCWALMMMVSILVYNLPSEALKAGGHPELLFAYQIAYVVFLVPICIFSAKVSFHHFVVARTISIIVQIILFLVLLKKYINCSLKQFFKEVKNPIICGAIVLLSCVLAGFIPIKHFYVSSFIQIIIIAVVYILSIILFFKEDATFFLSFFRRKNS